MATVKQTKRKPTGAAAMGAGPGRPKGSVNKTTKAAKDAIAEAAEALGGTDRLVEWAKADKRNESVFWGTIYPKLLPFTVAGDPNNPLKTITQIQLVALK